MACGCQCWGASGQATNWVGRQPHPLADRLTQDSMSPQSTLDMAHPSGEPALASGPALLSRGQTSYTSKPPSPSRPNREMGLTGPQPCPRALGHPGPHTQLRQKLAHSTSDLTPALGHPSLATRLQDLALPARRPARTPESDFTHQWVSYSPGVLWTLIMPSSSPEDLWGSTISRPVTRSCQLVPAASTKGRAGQAGGPGAKQAHQTAHIASPPQQKDSCSPHRGNP